MESHAGKLFLIKRENFSRWGSAKGLLSISVFINHLKDNTEIVLIKFVNEVKHKLSAANTSEKNEDIKLKCSLWPLFMGGEVMGLGSAI